MLCYATTQCCSQKQFSVQQAKAVVLKTSGSAQEKVIKQQTQSVFTVSFKDCSLCCLLAYLLAWLSVSAYFQLTQWDTVPYKSGQAYSEVPEQAYPTGLFSRGCFASLCDFVIVIQWMNLLAWHISYKSIKGLDWCCKVYISEYKMKN